MNAGLGQRVDVRTVWRQDTHANLKIKLNFTKKLIGFVKNLGAQADVITLELWSLAPRHSHTLARGRQLGLNN